MKVFIMPFDENNFNMIYDYSVREGYEIEDNPKKCDAMIIDNIENMGVCFSMYGIMKFITFAKSDSGITWFNINIEVEKINTELNEQNKFDIPNFTLGSLN